MLCGMGGGGQITHVGLRESIGTICLKSLSMPILDEIVFIIASIC